MIEYNNYGFLDGYEDWNIRELNSSFFYLKDSKSTYTRLSSSFFYWYSKSARRIRAVSTKRIYRQLADYNDLHNIKWLEPFTSMKHIPQEGESIYFAPGCKFPRTKIKRNFKWVPSQIGADVVVLPTAKHIDYYPEMCIFFLDDTKEIFLLSIARYTLSQDPPKIGQTISEYVEHRRKEIPLDSLNDPDNEAELTRIGNAVCKSIGSLVAYDKIMDPVIDAVEGLYRSIIFEEDLLKFINTDHVDDITSDLVESLDMQINSEDPATRCMALKALAALDYKKYPSVARYLLRHVDRWKEEVYCSAGVDFMRKFLKIDLRNTWTLNDSIIYGQVSPEEFPVMKDILEKECHKSIEKIVHQFQGCTNLKISVNCDVTIEE